MGPVFAVVLLLLSEPRPATIDGALLLRLERTARPRQLVFLHLKSEPDAALLGRLRALGVVLGDVSWIPPVGRHPDGYLIADVPSSRLLEIAELPQVSRIRSGETRLEPLRNDVAAGAAPLGVQANALHALGYDGTGVRVAVLDSSLDVLHPDVPTPIAAEDYSSYPTLDGDVRSLVTGHGTHVTGSVLGRGTASAGLYAGQAPGADLVFLKIGNDSDSSATGAAMAAAIRAAVDVYQADVITSSYGGFGTYQDGSEEVEQAADYAFSRGAVVFFSAGNAAGSRIHASGTVAAGSLGPLIQVDVGSTSSTTLYFELIWQDGIGTTTDLDLRFYDPSQVEITSGISLVEHPESPRGTESDEASRTAPVSGPSTYWLRVENHSATPQAFHLFSFGERVTFASPDPRYTVLLPSIADEAISVAAYCSRSSFVNWCGSTQGFGQTLGTVATFSSRGPRIGDEGEKPTLAAPGTAVISALDSDRPYASSLWIADDGVTDCNGPAHYCALQGTSMACPTAAGATALLLHAFPVLRGHPGIVRDLVRRSSDGVAWSDASGYGFMDVSDAHSAAVLLLAPDGSDFPVTQVALAPFEAHAVVSIEAVEIPSGLDTTSFVATIGGSSASVLSASFDSGRGQWELMLDPPALPVGAHDVVLRASYGGRTTPDATIASGYVVREPVRVLSVTPSFGPIAGGTAITIAGTGYTSDLDTSVSIGGVPASSFTVVSDTQIDAVTPAGLAGFADVDVANPFGSATLAAAFEYFEPISLATIDPGFGPTGGGTILTITGSGFTTDAETTVTIGGSLAPTFHVVDASTIEATTPPGTTGLADVDVSSPRSSASLAAAFEYLGPETTCLYGTVNLGAGPRTDVLLANGSSGEERTRRVTLAVGEPFALTMDTSPSRASSPFVLFAWRTIGDPTTVRLLPFGIGCTSLPTPVSGGTPQPVVIFNNVGFERQVGTATHRSHPAPSTIVSKPGGFSRPLLATLQGIILDDASAGSRSASVTNGIVLEVQSAAR